jgi:hypothetical protein
MLTGSSPRTLILLAAPCLLAGCAQPGSVFSRYTTIGTLKTSLSQLEFENQQLRAKVTNLESENRDIENRLVQEEATNGELSARLDDARDVIGQRGAGWESDGSSPNTNPNRANPPSRTLPAGRSNRPPRKPPFARIPGPSDGASSSDGFNDDFNRPSFPSPESLGPQSLRDDDAQWLPIARGGAASATKVR